MHKAHIIYTFFVNCIRQVEEFKALFFFDSDSGEAGHLSGGNTSSTCRMQMTKYVYMMCAVMQIIPFSCWENLLNLVLDMWKKALKHSSSNRRNFKHFKHDETDWFLARCSYILWTQTKHINSFITILKIKSKINLSSSRYVSNESKIDLRLFICDFIMYLRRK